MDQAEESGKHPYGHPIERFAFILEGEVTLTLGPEEHQLAPGDTVMILPGDVRAWHNRGVVPARILLVTARGEVRLHAPARRNRAQLTDEAHRALVATTMKTAAA